MYYSINIELLYKCIPKWRISMSIIFKIRYISTIDSSTWK